MIRQTHHQPTLSIDPISFPPQSLQSKRPPNRYMTSQLTVPLLFCLIGQVDPTYLFPLSIFPHYNNVPPHPESSLSYSIQFFFFRNENNRYWVHSLANDSYAGSTTTWPVKANFLPEQNPQPTNHIRPHLPLLLTYYSWRRVFIALVHKSVPISFTSSEFLSSPSQPSFLHSTIHSETSVTLHQTQQQHQLSLIFSSTQSTCSDYASTHSNFQTSLVSFTDFLLSRSQKLFILLPARAVPRSFNVSLYLPAFSTFAVTLQRSHVSPFVSSTYCSLPSSNLPRNYTLCRHHFHLHPHSFFLPTYHHTHACTLTHTPRHTHTRPSFPSRPLLPPT